MKVAESLELRRNVLCRQIRDLAREKHRPGHNDWLGATTDAAREVCRQQGAEQLCDIINIDASLHLSGSCSESTRETLVLQAASSLVIHMMGQDSNQEFFKPLTA